MNTIYCIEDCEGKKYIGVTKQELKERLKNHRFHYNHMGKYSYGSTASQNLNMKDCKIYELETCSDEDRQQREKYHIENTDCVNRQNNNQEDIDQYKKDIKAKIDDTDDIKEKYRLRKCIYNKTYYQKKREFRNTTSRMHYEKNKEHIANLSKFRYYAKQGRLDDLYTRYPDIYENYIHLKEKYMN